MSTVNVKCEEGIDINNHATDETPPSENITENSNNDETIAEKNNDSNADKHENDKKDANKNGPDTAPKPVSRPPYIPPHLMGRDLNDPAQDMIGTGRRVQKPRLGVKVPYRNLTSQIVSQDEIAQEIFERSLRKYSYSEVPEGGDVFFAMKLTHRLANKITSTDTTSDKTNAGIAKKIETIENLVLANDRATPAKKIITKVKETERKADSSNTAKPPAEKPSEEPQPTTETNKPVETNKNDTSNFESKADQLYAEISSTLGEQCKLTPPLKLSPNANSCPKNNSKVLNGSISQASEPELDNDTLLAILEGTSDISDVSMNAASTPKVEAKPRKKRIKPMLDPNVEKELALKQLMDFETKKKEDRLKKSITRKDEDLSNQSSTINTTADSADTSQDISKSGDSSKPDAKKVKKLPFNSGSTAPKRFPKKYQRIIKRQLRSSKLKVKTASPDQQKKLPEVPEVQIAIDRYIKTYASKRKLRPETEEKPAEKKLKESSEPEPSTVNETPDLQQQESDENRKDSSTTVDEEIKENESPANPKPKANSKVMREINRLLGDEGAINMIYSIEQKRLPDNKRDANILPSLRRKKKDLLLKTKLVKNAVLRLSMSPGQLPGRVRRTSPEITQSKSTTSPSRKTSIESVDSIVSEPSPKVRKVAAEASRIIRRHSSSSAYSSDEDETDIKVEKTPPPAEAAKTPETSSAKSDEPAETNNNENPVKEKIVAERRESAGKEKVQKEVAERRESSGKEKVQKEVAERRESAGKEKVQKEVAERRESAGKEKVQKEITERRESASSNTSKRKDSKDDDKIQSDTTVSAYSELVKQLSLKEITVRRYDNLVQIILISSSGKMKNAMNIQVFNELTSVLCELEKDDNCRTVLVTSTGSSFCQGIDLQALICSDKAERRKIVNEYVTALLNFTKRLSHFKKVLIAGVHGAAVGLGVTMLPFFDMVFASDKATFYTPYVKLGQIPEAGATLTLPHLLGNAVTSELLFGCRMLTAGEALQFGLVTRILWPDKFGEELLPIARGVASHSSQSMEATKLLLRKSMNEKLEEQLNTESKLLEEHWCSEECQKLIKEYLQQEALLQND